MVSFPLVLKSAKVVSVFKKDSKLDHSDFCPMSLLFNIKKVLEKLMHKILYTYFNKNNIIYK